ncbi:MAG TPA: ABC transporter substrate-binding protein [Ferrovibrio sp.]|jgi:NitT/TauT family transport system substrate-binding protein|uniref:ABC transporter substrate-binding protein n=1 Tax=Ferrovibrio sp. TaxID=1917215 RepID=UPI002ED20A0F
MLKRRLFVAGIATAATFALLPTLAAPALAKDRAVIAALPFISTAPVFIAKERGYFDAEGIDLDIKTFNAAQAVAVAVASGDADFGVTAFTGGFFNLAGKGALKVIAAQSREEPGYKFVAYIASKKAYDAGFRSPKDFPGKTVAITTVGSSFHYNLGMLADKYGFKLDQVTMKPVQSVPNMMAALSGGQVDATILPANNALKLEHEGTGKIIGWVSDYTPWQLGALFTSTKNVKDKRPMVERFVKAYQKGLADYAAAFLAKDSEGNRMAGEKALAAMPALEKWVKPTPTLDVVKIGANYMDPQGRLDVKNIYEQLAWYQEQGLVDKSVKAEDFLDLSFVKGHFGVPKKK